MVRRNDLEAIRDELYYQNRWRGIMFFKCNICENDIHMNKKTINEFQEWAYEDCVEWTNLDDEIPSLDKDIFGGTLNVETPQIGEEKILFVKKPFDEELGNEFYVKFEPALIHYNGYDGYIEEFPKCAIVKCRFEKIISYNEYCAFIRVIVIDVILLHDIYKRFPEKTNKEPIEEFGVRAEVIVENESWTIIAWSMQGDVGGCRWIYTDIDGKRHLVMEDYYSFDEEILYVGNITAFER